MRIADIDHFYYFAYGHNTNSQEMLRRAPTARLIGSARLKNFQFILKNYSDIMPQDGASVMGVLWRVHLKDLDRLDHDEGLHINYNRIPVPVHCRGKTYRAMAYIMDPSYTEHDLPSRHYLKLVTQGYKEHNISLWQIKRALEIRQREQ